MSVPIVSICMITFNHERFIEQAIESILCQDTSFSYEIIICDDKSSDNTCKKIEKYVRKSNVSLIKNTQNLGPWRSLELTFKQAKGKYIALLEGDDYWTKKTKLQEQIEFLEKNNKYSMCFGNADSIDETGRMLMKNIFKTNNSNREIDYKDILNLNCPPTRTVCFRKTCLPEFFPDCYYLATGGDTYLFSQITKDSPSYFVDEPLAVWRIRKKSLFSSLSTYERRKNVIGDFKRFYACFTEIENKLIISNTLTKSYYILLIQNLKMLRIIEAFNSFLGWAYWMLVKTYIKVLN